MEQQVDGTTSYITTDAHGLKTVKRHGSDGSITVTAPDSTTTFTKMKPDPRFGMQAPITDTLKVTTPAGLTSVFSQTRTITQMTGDRVTGLTDSLAANGKVTVSEYDGNQDLTTTTSPEGRQTFSYTDSLGRIIQSSVPGIAPVNYSYDANGNLASITPPGQPAHTFAYTEVDLTDSYAPPAVPDSAGGINYLYDQDKKLLSTVFFDSSSIEIVYDTASAAGSTRPVAINYDQGTTSFAYDSTSGNLTSVVSSDSVVTNYSYDGSLITQMSWQGPVTGTLDFAYNNDFQVTSQTINRADTVAFSYDDDGLLVGAGSLSMAYDVENGLLTVDTLGNINSSYAYNAFGELSGKNSEYVGTDLYDRSFTRDSLGRITSITEIIEGDTTLFEYAYNAIGYLVQVKEDGAVTAEYQYDDSNGNRTAYITPTDTVTATYDEQDRMLTYGNASYSYGPRGDLQHKIVGADTTLYNYDNLGNLRSVALPDGNFIEYIIDGRDRRVAKQVNGAIIKRWIYQDQLNPIAEVDSLGNVTARFVYGSKVHVPDYMIKNDTTYAIVTDHLGSVRLVVNIQSVEIRQRIDYDEYGNVLTNTNMGFQPFGYAGGLYDRETELVRFGARDYDPKVGRWTSKDPILFEGGTSNLYEYVINDPVNDVDPNGLQSTLIPPINALETTAATLSFIGNYKSMREANTIGADKYFHCMANCQASKFGLKGYLTATAISEGREIFDQIKGDPPSACFADRVANNVGRNPRGNTDCQSRCQVFRPKGLDPKF